MIVFLGAESLKYIFLREVTSTSKLTQKEKELIKSIVATLNIK